MGRKSIYFAARSFSFRIWISYIKINKCWKFGIDPIKHFFINWEKTISFCQLRTPVGQNGEKSGNLSNRGPKLIKWNRFFSIYGKVFNWINTKFSAFVYLCVRNSNPEEKGSSCKINGFPAKNVLKLNWAWQAYFLSHTLHILWEFISFKNKEKVKVWFWYLHWFKIYRKSVWVFCPYL